MGEYDSHRHHRRSIRLKGYNYTHPGAYFVTICTYEHSCLFGRVVDGKMRLNGYGEMVRDEWFRSVNIRSEIELYPDEFVVMPNHIHGIVWIVDNVGATGRSPLPSHYPPRGPAKHSLSSFIAGFKSAVTKRINRHRHTPGGVVWQRNYYEHIIRTELALNAIRQYIRDNPLRWHLDQYNPNATGNDPMPDHLGRLTSDNRHPYTKTPNLYPGEETMP